MTRRRRIRGWTPPTGAGLARWRRLLADARRAGGDPNLCTLDLARSAAAVRRDSFPGREKSEQRELFDWIGLAAAFAQAPLLERVGLVQPLARLNDRAAAIMGEPAGSVTLKNGSTVRFAGDPGEAISGQEARQPGDPGYRADLDG